MEILGKPRLAMVTSQSDDAHTMRDCTAIRAEGTRRMGYAVPCLTSTRRRVMQRERDGEVGTTCINNTKK